MVPTLSIFFMAVALLISFGLPIGLFLFWRKRHALKILPALGGTAGFIVFALILEQILHYVVLRPQADGTIAMRAENPVLFTLYGIFAAGLFEETARFSAFKLLRRKYAGVGTALSYGIGHGGAEAIILQGISSAANIALSLMINAGVAGAAVTAMVPGVTATLAESSPYLFLMGGIERVSAFALHVSLSVLVWHAANRRGKLWLYPLAIALHAGLNLFAALYQAGILRDLVLLEALIGACAAGIVVLTVFLHRRFQGEALL